MPDTDPDIDPGSPPAPVTDPGSTPDPDAVPGGADGARDPHGPPGPATNPTAGTAPEPPAGRLHAATVLLAALGVVVALAGLVVGTRPLATPTQDCGTPFTFLLHGRVDVFVDPADPPSGVSAAEAEANNTEPCQERAADRARPAAGLVVGGTLVAALAAGTDLAVRSWRWYRIRPPRPPRPHRA